MSEEWKGAAAQHDARQDVMAALARMPTMRDLPPMEITIDRLGGLTNRNYRLETTRGRFVLLIPGAGTSEYINRQNEAQAARIAAEIGVNAELLWFDERDGVMLCRFVDGAITMNAERFKDLGAVAADS